MTFGYADDIREHMPPGYFEWLQEEILPHPLNGCVLSAIPPVLTVRNDLSVDRKFSYTSRFFDSHGVEFTQLDKMAEDGSITKELDLHDVVADVFTRMDIVTHLLTNSVTTIAISDHRVSITISLCHWRRVVLGIINTSDKLPMHVVVQLTGMVDIMFNTFEDDYVCDTLHSVLGGTWTLLVGIDASMSAMRAVSAEPKDPGEYDDKIIGLAVPSRKGIVEIRDSELLDKLFSKSPQP